MLNNKGEEMKNNNKPVLKKYKVKVKIPCVVYKDYYVEAANSSNAMKTAEKDHKNGNCDSWPEGIVMDFSGDYDHDQLHHKAEAVEVDSNILYNE